MVVLLVLGIGGAAVGYGLIRSYLHSDAFRLLLSRQVSRAADVDGSFSPLRWEGMAARTGGFTAIGDGPVTMIRADDMRTEIGLDGLRDGYWLLRGSAARNVEITVDARRIADAPARPAIDDFTPPPAPKAPAKSRWLPRELRFDEIDLQNLKATVLLDDGPLVVSGPRVRARGADGARAIDLDVRGGTIRPPMDWLPEFRLDGLTARHRDGTVFLSEASLRMFENGTLQANGEIDLGGSGGFALQGDFGGIDAADVFSEDWSRRITGRIRGNYTVAKSPAGLRANGFLEMREGVVTALPLLDVLAAYADTRRFRILTLHEASTDWEWTPERIVLRNLKLTSEGLVRLEGRLTIEADGRIDGDFRLGLPPGTLATIPGAETVVFLPGEHGLMWTPLRVGGTLNDPSEDLSDRLIAAAGSRMFEILPETGERVLKFTRSILGDSPAKALDRGLDVIERGTSIIEKNAPVIREASGLLDGLLRGRRREPPADAQPPPADPENAPQR
jgi:hypothetical protein